MTKSLWLVLVTTLALSGVEGLARAEKEAKVDGKGKAETIEAPCMKDAETLCPGLKPGDGKFGPCMKEHKDQLSEACRQKIEERMKDRKEKSEKRKEVRQEAKDKVMAACKDDAAKFCPGLVMGDGKWGPCLKEHKEQLSEGCKKAFMDVKEKVMKRREAKEGKKEEKKEEKK